MRELSIEEKAKAYDEALERAKERRGMAAISKDDLEFIFPELKNEDERIRKWIIENIQETLDVDGFFEGKKTMAKNAIAWLEKQKEPKYLDTSDCEPFSDEQTRRNLINFLKSLGATEISKASYDSFIAWLEKQGQQKPFDYENADIQRKDFAQKSQRIVSAEAKEALYSKPTWSEEDEKTLNTTSSFLSEYAAKGYENAVMCIDWLKSLKERFK